MSRLTHGHLIAIIQAFIFAFLFWVVGEFFKVNQYQIILTTIVVFILTIWALWERIAHREKIEKFNEMAEKFERSLSDYKSKVASLQEPFEILKATYGTGEPKESKDVTEILRESIDNNKDKKLDIIACNAIFTDPAYGKTKTLTIELRVNGIIVTKEFAEGKSVIIPPVKLECK